MDRKFSFREKLSYAFDNMMSKGSAGLIIWLAVLTVILIVAFSLAVILTKSSPGGESFGTLLWMSLMRTLDAGTVCGDQGSPTFLLIMLLVTFGGIFIFSMLIGILTTSLESKLDALRKGRSRVVEENHTVILGWSEQVFTILSELAIANENQKNPCVAIMADRDKVEMEDEIQTKVGSTKNTRVVCRTGSPVESADLEMMSLRKSRSIIILSPESENPDSEVIKTMLAIINRTRDRTEPLHMVALIRDPENYEVAKIVGKEQAEIVLAGDLIARMAAQTTIQSGLSIVYQELMDYGGDEIYFTEEPGIVGKTFREVLSMYETSAIIGLKPAAGLPMLNPPMDTVVAEGDSVIAISEDDDTVVLSGRTGYPVDESNIVDDFVEIRKPCRIIMLGWNWRAPIIIRELDNYLESGSVLRLVADGELCAPGSPPDGMSNLRVDFTDASTTDRRILDRLRIEQYDHVIILSYTDSLSAQEADSATLMTLLHIRDIAESTGRSFSLVSEMRDIRNRNLAEITGADDYIVSDQMLSLLLTQISENKYLSGVFWDLFDPEGSEIYLKPAARYVREGIPVSFYTVIESAARMGEVAIGYRVHSLKDDAGSSYGVVVNPNKDETVTFGENDRIIVLAED
jgi:voltage-gated potassium channel Kch